MTQATITSKGQITIPKIVRDVLHLHTGDRVDFVVTDSGEAIIRPVSQSVDDVFGMLSSTTRSTRTVEEINTSLRKAFRKRKA